MSVTPAIGQTVWVRNARGETVPNVHFNVFQVNDPTRLPPVQVIPQAQRANETVAEYAERLSPYEFKSREDIERFMVMNPQGFREALEQDEKFRANVKELMQSWDTVAITGLAWCMQSKGHKDALDGSPLLLETVAHDFYEWAHQETRSIAANPYHRLASFEAHHEKRQQEREQIITQNEREQAERAAKQQAEREHSAQQQAERQNRQIQTAVLSAWENFVTRASELNAKLTIHDPAAAAFLSSGLPDALKTGHQAQMAAMGVLSFEHPDNVLYNVSQLAAQKPAFAKELAQFGLTQNDLTDPSRINEVYKAVGLIVAEGRGGMGEQDLMRFLSPQTAQTLNEIRNVVSNPNLDENEKAAIHKKLAAMLSDNTGELWALQPQQQHSLTLPEPVGLPLPQGVGHQQPFYTDFDMG